MDCKCSNYIEGFSISTIISIAALLISIAGVITAIHVSRTQLRIDYYTEHFKDALSIKIPYARGKIIFENERINGCESLQEALSEMRRGADYFKYASPRFYKRFVRLNQDAEDYFIGGLNGIYGETKQKEFLKQGDKKLHKLYKTINRYYFG